MHPAPASFLPAYHYEPAMGLTLYHHDHYVHYSTVDIILRAILAAVLITILICLICYLVGMCQRQQEAYEHDYEQVPQPLSDEEKINAAKYDYVDHGSEAWHLQQHQAAHNAALMAQ